MVVFTKNSVNINPHGGLSENLNALVVFLTGLSPIYYAAKCQHHRVSVLVRETVVVCFASVISHLRITKLTRKVAAGLCAAFSLHTRIVGEGSVNLSLPAHFVVVVVCRDQLACTSSTVRLRISPDLSDLT